MLGLGLIYIVTFQKKNKEVRLLPHRSPAARDRDAMDYATMQQRDLAFGSMKFGIEYRQDLICKKYAAF